MSDRKIKLLLIALTVVMVSSIVVLLGVTFFNTGEHWDPTKAEPGKASLNLRRLFDL